MLRRMGVLLLAAWCGHAQPTSLRPGEGFIPVTGGPVWFKVIGEGKGTPLLLVHGGPGGRSCRFEPMAERLGRERPVILYDQLGTGRSGRPQDRTLWTLARLTKELDQVRRALKLRSVHLLGHSCGGTLVAEYLATHPRAGIRAVVLSSPVLSTPLWLEDAKILRAKLPPATQEALARHEAAGTTDNPEYLAAVAVADRQFFAPEGVPLHQACEESHPNMAIYRAMWGPSEFHATGSLKHFDRTGMLPTLRMPVLFLCGRSDEIRVESLAAFRDRTPGAFMHVFEQSHHLAFIEEVQRYADVVGAFLAEADRRGR